MFLFSFKKRNPNSQEYFNLAPRFFKWIGMGFIGLSFFTKLIILSMHIPYFSTHPDDRVQLGSKLFILGLFFIAFSKDKREDDIVNRIRLKAMAQSLVSVIFYYLICFTPEGLGVGGNLQAVGGFIVMFLLTYITAFHIKKYKNNKRDEKLDKRRKSEAEDDARRISESTEGLEALD